VVPNKTRLDYLESALDRLEEAIELSHKQESEHLYRFLRDSVIKSLEFSCDLLWKSLKDILESKHGIMVASPRAALKEALNVDILNKKEFEILEDLISDRNDSSHKYDESMANEIAKRAENYHIIMAIVLKNLHNIASK